MSWGAQNRSKDAKTPCVAGVRSRNPKPALCGIQPYAAGAYSWEDIIVPVAPVIATEVSVDEEIIRNLVLGFSSKLCLCVYVAAEPKYQDEEHLDGEEVHEEATQNPHCS
jgi:hypothetical protein